MTEAPDSTDKNLLSTVKDGFFSKPKKSENSITNNGSPDLKYNMSHKRRGMCLLINQKRFDPRTGQTTRNGTDVDADRAEGVFRKLGFQIQRYMDLSVNELLCVIRDASQIDHADCDCFALIILSHGNDDLIYGTDGTLPIGDLTRPFAGDNCPSLAGKPKLFFFQACRGTKFDVGVDMTDSLLEEDGDKLVSTKLPVEADFLFAFSTVPGYFSWRNNQDGSWFIQSLCKVLRQHSFLGIELMHMLILVNRLVATSFESCTDQEWSDKMKQMPNIDCRLTKLVYFNQKPQ